MKNVYIIILFTSLVLISDNGFFHSCTIFNATQSGVTLVGNNEDGTDPITYVWFLPAEKGKYGRVYFGLSDKWPQGGMNDQGLFYDGTSAPLLELKKSRNKPIYNGNLSEKMLEECATVKEALKLLEKYNLDYFRNGEMMIVDRFGNSVVIECDTIIYKKEPYQVVTNFYQSNPRLGGYPCPRYDIAECMLKNMKEISVDYFRNILDAVHTRGYTQYSNIYDLNNRIIYLFRDSNFQEYITLDLQKELKKGKQLYALSSLFSNHFKHKVVDGRNYYSGQYHVHYSNGNIKSEINLENSKLNGQCCGYYENGQISWSRTYEKGKLSSWKQWSEYGKSALQMEIHDEYITKATEFYPGGKKLFEFSFKKIAPYEIFVWNEDGTESYSGVYKSGLFYLNDMKKPYTGELITYYKNGQKHKKRNYKHGKREGAFIEWDEKGKKIKEEIFRENVLIKAIYYKL